MEIKNKKNEDIKSPKTHTPVIGMEIPENNQNYSHLNSKPKKLIKTGFKSILKVKLCSHKLNLTELYLFTPEEIRAVKSGIKLYLELNTKQSELENKK